VTDRSATIDRVLDGAGRIAVVGFSANPYRTSHGIALGLVERGYDVVGVNPTIDAAEVAGIPVVADLASIVGHIDVVDVFRAAQHLPGVAAETVARGDVGAFWAQLGLRSEEARATVEGAGIAYVEDACIEVEMRRRGSVAAGA
jgi:uncharacterized protein